MIRIQRTFKTGYINAGSRGLILGKGLDKLVIDNMAEEVVGENCFEGISLTNIRLVIEIEKVEPR